MSRRKRKGIIQPAYPPLNYNKNSKPLEETLKKKWVVEAVELMKQGYSTSYIRQQIAASKKGKVNSVVIDNILATVNELIFTESLTGKEQVKMIHVRRYNRQINRLLATEELDFDKISVDKDGDLIGEYSYDEWFASREKKKTNYWNAIAALQQKEKVLQFHNDGFEFEINTEENVNVVDKKPKYDVTKLTFEEQLELYELMKKAKKGENELLSVVESVKSLSQEVQDAEAVVIPPANIEQIAHEKLEVVVEKPTFVIDPTARLKERMKQIAARTLQGIGGHLDDTEKRFLEDDKPKT